MINYGWCEVCYTQLIYGSYQFKEGADATIHTGWFCPNCRTIKTVVMTYDTCE